ncbi:MAG: hypothetical protein U0169_22415 [Polyangiaceae bacterium]
MNALLKITLAASVLLPAVVLSPRAEACGVFFEGGRPPSPKLVAQVPKRTPSNAVEVAQVMIDSAAYATAATTLATTFPTLKTGDTTSPVDARAHRLMALALVRSEGAAGSAQFPTATADQKLANVQWAIGALRGLNARRTNDPALQADLGEALAHVPSLHDEARKVLGALAEKDLMGSGHAYAALAKLHAEAGDAKATELALSRCKAMATDKSVCKTPEIADGKALALAARS